MKVSPTLELLLIQLQLECHKDDHRVFGDYYFTNKNNLSHEI